MYPDYSMLVDGKPLEYWYELRDQMHAAVGPVNEGFVDDLLVQLRRANSKVLYYEEMIRRMNAYRESADKMEDK